MTVILPAAISDWDIREVNGDYHFEIKFLDFCSTHTEGVYKSYDMYLGM